MADRYLNLVFQGGGVRGIAYAGVLEKMPSHCKLHTVSGASAGSIVAGLLAIGRTPAEIKAILSDRELFSLLDPADAERLGRIQQAAAAIPGVWDSGQQKLRWWQSFQFLRRHAGALRDVRSIWDARGIHRSERLRTWLDKITQGKRFRDATFCEDLRIIAADVSERGYFIYSKVNSIDRPIAEAIHASASIPLFFTPAANGSSQLVDGGLLSNFPTFLVGLGHYPTIGFRLIDFEPPAKDDGSTLGYLRALLLTMTEAHDKFRDRPSNFKEYAIRADVPATKFNLTEAEAARLYELGRGVGNEVDWGRYSSETATISYFDPRPHESLELSLGETHRLWQTLSQKSQWLEELSHDAEYNVYIEQDWTVRYERQGAIEVKGARPLMATKYRALLRPELAVPMSLADVRFEAEEILPGGRRPLIRIPAFNGGEQKGFLLFYDPPVFATDGPRLFRTQFEIPREFASTVAKGGLDVVSYEAQQLAHRQRMRMTFRVFVDSALPNLRLDSHFGHPILFQGEEFDASRRRPFRRYEAKTDWFTVSAAVQFRVEIAIERPGR
jgi:NTE family protein